MKATPLSERIPTVLGAQKSDDAFSSSSRLCSQRSITDNVWSTFTCTSSTYPKHS